MSLNPFPKTFQEVVGLVPAGGLGTRTSPLPCSKELYPIGFMRQEIPMKYARKWFANTY
jgi:hypothetical protein